MQDDRLDQVGLRRDYTAIASRYEHDRFRSRNGAFLWATDRFIVRELVSGIKPSIVLDVPTGTGRVFDYLVDFPGMILGCDVTPAMLEMARTKAGGPSRFMVRADALRLPFASGTFDCVISLRFFHLFRPEDRRQFAREFGRVLRPEGYLVCSFTNGWYGGGINWARKILGCPTTEFLVPGELRSLFPNWKVCALRGNFWPCQWRVASKSDRLEKLFRWLNGKTPLNLLCWERFYLLRKASCS